MYDDLNSPSGERLLCPPIRYPQSRGNGYLGPSLSFVGPFALTLWNPHLQAVLLERCHSPLHLELRWRTDTLDPDIASSAAVVLPMGVSDKLDGVFLPSLRRFVIAGPKRIRAIWSAVVSERTVYIVAGRISNQIWSAQLPPS